jgi:bifunctional oligoribonuclease and PAP phosphatase NrnA
MNSKKIINQIVEAINNAQRIAISSHIRPDADSIGSSLALFFILKQMGKEVFLLNTDKAPFPLTELPGSQNIQYRQIYPDPYDVVILVEGGTEERTGMTHLEHYFTINIDHHASSAYESNINWVDPNAAAVAELVYQLAQRLGTDWTKEVGVNLYAAISSDTGSFKYSNTTAKSLKIASQLIEKCKFDPIEVSDLIFNSNHLEKVKMIQKVLATLELRYQNRIAMIDFKQKYLAQLSLKDIETEDVISIARSIQGVDVTLFFKEIGPDNFRISIRSKGTINSQLVARAFNGGGHIHAAGFFYKGPIHTAKDDIVAVVKKQMT